MTLENKFNSTPDAPVFYPTCDEFADPMEYVEKIRPIASRAGLCKIIPPKVHSIWHFQCIDRFLLSLRNGDRHFASMSTNFVLHHESNVFMNLKRVHEPKWNFTNVSPNYSNPKEWNSKFQRSNARVSIWRNYIKFVFFVQWFSFHQINDLSLLFYSIRSSKNKEVSMFVRHKIVGHMLHVKWIFTTLKRVEF